jgi:molybdenum cofactor cytidylyltransferase
LTGSVGAVILAAGSGARIGTPKLRLESAGRSYLEVILDLLERAKIRPVACVVARDEAEWARQYAARMALLINSRPELGMFSSVQLGVAALRAYQGLFIVPVDHPFVAVSTCRRLKEVFAQNPGALIKPAFEGRPGHPVVIPQAAYGEVLAAGADASLREVLRQSGLRHIAVDVDDAGILRNINERDDIGA